MPTHTTGGTSYGYRFSEVVELPQSCPIHYSEKDSIVLSYSKKKSSVKVAEQYPAQMKERSIPQIDALKTIGRSTKIVTLMLC